MAIWRIEDVLKPICFDNEKGFNWYSSIRELRAEAGVCFVFGINIPFRYDYLINAKK
jgi:hypothetical protein